MAYQDQDVLAMVGHNCSLHTSREGLPGHDRRRDLAGTLFYVCGAIKRPCFDWEHEVRLTLRAATPIHPQGCFQRLPDGTVSSVAMPLVDEATNLWRLIEVFGRNVPSDAINRLRAALEAANLPGVSLRTYNR